MVAHRDRFRLELPAPRDGHDHLAHVVFAVAAVATLAKQRIGARAFGLATELLLIAGASCLFEDEVLLDVRLKAAATLLDTDFLSVFVHPSVAGAEASCTVLALAE